MSNVLVIAEHVNGELKSVSLSAVTFAKQAAQLTGGQVIGLVLGSALVASAQSREVVDRIVAIVDRDVVKLAMAVWRVEVWRPYCQASKIFLMWFG